MRELITFVEITGHEVKFTQIQYEQNTPIDKPTERTQQTTRYTPPAVLDASSANEKRKKRILFASGESERADR